MLSYLKNNAFKTYDNMYSQVRFARITCNKKIPYNNKVSSKHNEVSS